MWRRASSPTPNDLHAVWGSGESDVFAVGAGGTVVHFEGRGWNVQPSETARTLRAVWGTGPQDIHAVGDGATFMRYDGARWTRQAFAVPRPDDPINVYGVWGNDGRRLVAVGGPRSFVFVNDGGDWQMTYQDAGPLDRSALWGRGDTLYEISTNGSASRIARGTIAGTTLPSFANTAQDVWCASQTPGCTQTTGSSQPLLALWGRDAMNIIAVGGQGTIVQKTSAAASFMARTSGTTAALRALWGIGADVWTVGDGGTIQRSLDGGGTWQAEESGTTQPLRGVWGTSTENVLAVGDDGIILRYSR